MNTTTLIITPKTKVLELIENYPQLENLLIELVPAFEKLKNPVLRRTVAKIATLQQAAIIGNTDISALINKLRQAVGQETGAVEDSQNVYQYTRPDWFLDAKVVTELDVREMLSRGEHPVNQVLADLKTLESGRIYKIIASFEPVPLIDKATGLGYNHWIDKKDESLYCIYFIML